MKLPIRKAIKRNFVVIYRLIHPGSSSRKQLIKTVETNLIGSHVKSLLEKGQLQIIMKSILFIRFSYVYV